MGNKKKFVFDIKNCTMDDIRILAQMMDEDYNGVPKGFKDGPCMMAIEIEPGDVKKAFNLFYEVFTGDTSDAVWRQPLEMMPLWINDTLDDDKPTMSSVIAKWRLRMGL